MVVVFVDIVVVVIDIQVTQKRPPYSLPDKSLPYKQPPDKRVPLRGAINKKQIFLGNLPFRGQGKGGKKQTKMSQFQFGTFENLFFKNV